MKYKVGERVEVKRNKEFHNDVKNKLKIVDYVIIIDEVVDWFEREDDNYYYSTDVEGWVFGDEHIVGMAEEYEPIADRFEILDL